MATTETALTIAQRMDAHTIFASQGAIEEAVQEIETFVGGIVVDITTPKGRAAEQAAKVLEDERRRVAAEAKAQREEGERRVANKQHRQRINVRVLSAMMEVGLGDEQARTLITAIAKGQIPHITIAY